ncbi:MAG: hypothetical protein AAB548_02720 [Patescibacteria group bacterium]
MKPFEFDVERLANVKGMNYDLAFKLVKVYPTPADLLGLDAAVLLLTIKGMTLEAADGALVYAHVLRKQDKEAGVVVGPVSIASLQALYDKAINAWLEKGMIFTGPSLVRIGGVDLWVKAEKRYFIISLQDGQDLSSYKVTGVTSLVNALSTMGRRQWQLPLDGVLRGLISFVESYETDRL